MTLTKKSVMSIVRVSQNAELLRASPKFELVPLLRWFLC
jgi:hypothetical protein